MSRLLVHALGDGCLQVGILHLALCAKVLRLYHTGSHHGFLVVALLTRGNSSLQVVLLGVRGNPAACTLGALLVSLHAWLLHLGHDAGCKHFGSLHEVAIAGL